METKLAFFSELSAVSSASDEEEETNPLKNLLKQKLPLTTSRVQRPVKPLLGQRNRVASAVPRKVPAINRSTSAPVAGTNTTQIMPSIPQNSSLLRHNISTSEVAEHTSLNNSSFSSDNSVSRPIQERRTVSTPSIGSVIMKPSTGILAMLKKDAAKDSAKSKKPPKRKASSISLAPENERIFAGKIFYWIPADEKRTTRQIRIAKARKHGAMWTTEWTPGITHLVVEKDYTYSDVKEYLGNRFKLDLDNLAGAITLVNDDYPNDCVNSLHLFNPHQDLYRVKGHVHAAAVDKLIASPAAEEENASLEIKKGGPRSRSGAPVATAPNHRSTQEISKGVQLPLEAEDLANLAQLSPLFTQPERVEYVSFGDELDEMINVARGFQHLPIDDEADDESRPSSSEGSEEPEGFGSDGERQRAAKTRRKGTKRVKASLDQDTFSCMTGGTGIASDSNPNNRTIEVLQEMADYYERIRDEWRSRAYRRVIGVLKKQSTKISTYDEAYALNFIGDRLAAKIEEIVVTNRLRRLDTAKQEPNDKIAQVFLKIYGAGWSQAGKWIRAGYKTLDDLVTHASLTQNQQIGIAHYDDFNTRIPRDEVTALGEVVKSTAATIDISVEIIIGGSYRRGAATSGDIDCLITKSGTSSTGELLPFLSRLVTKLTDSGFLVAALAVPGHRREDSASKWHGACVLPNSSKAIWRRIDLLLVPETEFGAALIYFTGDDIFNRSIRLLASKKHMRLNQRGLYKDVMRGPGRMKVSEGTLVEGADEKKIFAALGVPWRPPEQRIMQ